jgi:uncharacterized protein (DUF4415 family)
MTAAEPITFTRLADGTLLRRQPDGSFQPVADKSDRTRLDRLSESEIEEMASSDPDHPPLDDEFWRRADEVAPKEAISIKLDADVLAWFRSKGRGYQTRINAVLRRYMEARRKA